MASYGYSNYDDPWNRPVKQLTFLDAGSKVGQSVNKLLDTQRRAAMEVDYFIQKSGLDQSIISHGWGNGYIVINKTHPHFGKTHLGLQSFIHGGLTYSSIGSTCTLSSLDSKYRTDEYEVYGFHTSHPGDTLEEWTVDKVLLETNKLAKEFIDDAEVFHGVKKG